jgi:hypothetical protein
MEENNPLKEKVDLAPRSPGVYLTKDAAGKIVVYNTQVPSSFLKKCAIMILNTSGKTMLIKRALGFAF